MTSNVAGTRARRSESQNSYREFEKMAKEAEPPSTIAPSPQFPLSLLPYVKAHAHRLLSSFEQPTESKTFFRGGRRWKGEDEKGDMKTVKTMKTNRKLRDYPQIPSTPPPSEKKERGIVHLEEELEHERKYLGALCMENQELEEILQSLDKEIAYIKSNFPQQIAGDGKVHANNEFWLKYESQLEVNRKLEREKKHLLNEIKQIEEQGLINLDSLSQTELILYVKQLERTKTDLLSDLRCKEWGLDRQAKDIHHLNEMKRTLQAEIRHYDKEFAMFRHYKKTSCPSASPTDSRHSSVVQDRKLKFPKQKERGKSIDDGDVGDDVRNSLSQENVTETSKNEVMFSSLDESKLERMECESSGLGYRRRSLKGITSERKTNADAKKGPVKKTVSIASLPEVSKTKSKTPSPRIVSKTKRSKTESKVGNESPKAVTGSQSTNKPIKIIVTYETQTTKTTTTEKKVEEESQRTEKVKKSDEEDKAESFRSLEEVYEDDFEDSDLDKYEDKTIGFLTTRV